MNQDDFRCEIGQEQRFFDSRIATAYDDNVFLAIEEAVTSRTCRYTEALEFALTRQAQPFGLSAGGYHNRVRSVDCAAITDRFKRAGIKIHGGDMILSELCAHFQRMLLHFFHELRALNFSKSRIVLDFRRYGQLTTGLRARNNQRFPHGARGIDSRRPAGRT